MSKDINRLKVVLAEKKRTNKWLAEQLGKDPGTVSKWCTNSSQPSIEVFIKIAELLKKFGCLNGMSQSNQMSLFG